MKSVAVSIIMPIYNVEKYLEESLQSVLSQSLEEIEIITVDDGSNDLSGQILDDYAKKDARIKVIHKKNSGYGNSMNIGIDAARGKYISILEPDDFITKDMLLDLYNLAEEKKLDFVKSNFAFLEGEQGKYKIYPTDICSDRTVYNKVLDEKQKKELFKGYVAHWTCLYRREFLKRNDIYFNETPGASYQDTGFWFQTLFYAKRIYMTDKYYYHYRQDNPNSSIRDKSKVYCICSEYNFILSKLKDNAEFLEKYLPIYTNCCYAAYRDTLDRIADEHKEEFVEYISNEFSDLKECNLLDCSLMSEQDYEDISQIMVDYKDYYKKKKEKIEKLNTLLIPYKKIFIYGAGYMGKMVLKQLSSDNMKKMQGFVVTQKSEKEMQVLGMQVYEFGELKNLDSETGVIVGVTKKFEDEICHILIDNKFYNIILIP